MQDIAKLYEIENWHVLVFQKKVKSEDLIKFFDHHPIGHNHYQLICIHNMQPNNLFFPKKIITQRYDYIPKAICFRNKNDIVVAKLFFG